jgi:hypothetical protein
MKILNVFANILLQLAIAHLILAFLKVLARVMQDKKNHLEYQ